MAFVPGSGAADPAIAEAASAEVDGIDAIG